MRFQSCHQIADCLYLYFCLQIPIKKLLMLIEMAAQGGDKGVSDHREYEGNQEYEGHQEHEGKKKIKLDYFYECLDGINI